MALTVPLHLMQIVKWLVIWDQPHKPLKTQNVHLSYEFSFQLKAIENIYKYGKMSIILDITLVFSSHQWPQNFKGNRYEVSFPS